MYYVMWIYVLNDIKIDELLKYTNYNIIEEFIQ